MKHSPLLYLAIIAVFIMGVMLMISQNIARQTPSTVLFSPSPTSLDGTTIPSNLSEKFTSKNAIFTFHYPFAWKITDTTHTERGDISGKKIQTWTLTNFTSTGSNEGIPVGSTVVEFELRENTNSIDLDSVVTCNMKSISCDDVVINNQNYKRNVEVLNSGVTLIILGTIKDQTILKVTALVSQGDNQSEQVKSIESMVSTFILD